MSAGSTFKMQKVVFVCVFAIVCQTVSTVGRERTWTLRQKRMTNDEECKALMMDHGKPPLPVCCQMPNVLPGLDGAWGKCFETYKHFKDRPETKEYKEMAHGKEPPCLFNCIFKQSGLANSDGKLNEDAITKKISEGMSNDEHWKTVWQPTLKKCLDEAKSESTKTASFMNNPAGRLMKCYLRDLYMNCPKELWVESMECTNTKDLVQKCPEMPPPVFHPPPRLI